MEIEKVKTIIQDKYAELTSSVIEEVRRLPADRVPEQEDFDYADAWEAFAYQVQAEDSPHYADYEDFIDEICVSHLDRLSPTELKLLWLGSGGYVEWDEEDALAFPNDDQILDEVLEELFSWVEQKAADLDLDDDDEDEDDDPVLDESGVAPDSPR